MSTTLDIIQTFDIVVMATESLQQALIHNSRTLLLESSEEFDKRSIVLKSISCFVWILADTQDADPAPVQASSFA